MKKELKGILYNAIIIGSVIIALTSGFKLI
jgi:hypothetical protein